MTREQELVKRIIRLENQVSALLLINKVTLEELVNLYHKGTITEDSVQRLFSQTETLKTLGQRKNGDRP